MKNIIMKLLGVIALFIILFCVDFVLSITIFKILYNDFLKVAVVAVANALVIIIYQIITKK